MTLIQYKMTLEISLDGLGAYTRSTAWLGDENSSAEAIISPALFDTSVLRLYCVCTIWVCVLGSRFWGTPIGRKHLARFMPRPGNHIRCCDYHSASYR